MFLNRVHFLVFCVSARGFCVREILRFSNYAFHADKTNLTSCARPALFQNVLSESNGTRIYGPIDSDAFHEIGTFSSEDHIPYIFTATNSNIVLDNLQITSSLNVSLPIMYGVSGGITLIADSAIENGYDVSYNADNCSVIHNDRLNSNHSMINWLMIECENFEVENDFNVQTTSSSPTTAFVDHFSPTTLWFQPVSTSYYPGENVQFHYPIGDRLGNVIDEEHAENITINLSGDSFISSLRIDEKGHCLICEKGLWLSSITTDNVLENYKIQMAMGNDELVLGQSTITLNIIECPVGFYVSDEKLCSKMTPAPTPSPPPRPSSEKSSSWSISAFAWVMLFIFAVCGCGIGFCVACYGHKEYGWFN